MRTLTLLFSLTYSLISFAGPASLDDEISERLAPLLSNYLGSHSSRFEVFHLAALSDGIVTRTPVLLTPFTNLSAESLQDCDENSSSTVCGISKSIDTFIKQSGINKGTINLTVTVMKDNKPIKVFKDIEILKFD